MDSSSKAVDLITTGANANTSTSSSVSLHPASTDEGALVSSQTLDGDGDTRSLTNLAAADTTTDSAGGQSLPTRSTYEGDIFSSQALFPAASTDEGALVSS